MAGNLDKDPQARPPPVERYDIFTQVFINDYLTEMIMPFMDEKAFWVLLNVSHRIRETLLTHSFKYYKRAVITRKNYPSRWPEEHPTKYSLLNEMRKKKAMNKGKFPKKQFFDRFTDFAFEELILGKLLRRPYWYAPTIDYFFQPKIDDLGISLTTLVLDGTAVTGRGLFGSVAMPISADIYRTSPGLISYLANGLRHLSVRYCQNIQHSDILIYLLMPPSNYTKLSLFTLRAYGCGEAPTEGPFHNLPGYGSKNKITQKADNILNIQILALLFPAVIPIEHHKSVTAPLSVPPNDTNGIQTQRTRIEELYYAGWLSTTTLWVWPPQLTRVDTRTGIMIPGPWGGFLATMHESLMLQSTCVWKDIKLDWVNCAMGRNCYSLRSQTFAPVAKINVRTGRIVAIGNLHGALIGGQVRRSDYHYFHEGIIPRVPVALSVLVPNKQGLYLPYPADRAKAKPPDDPYAWPDEKRYQPWFNSLEGKKVGPRYDDPDLTGEVYKTVVGLSGEGNHVRSAAGLGRRRESGGKVCVNCGLWEYEDYVIRLKDGVRYKNPGRGCGEVCEVCVPFLTCGDCGE
ncbi:hypothetical protein TWF694_011204 [Orbilia ellipsospora]|uniref:F-box domain-containing protein n=1 Tax=Orbilia ellipsospora TaxID=2528407 RepID=A0AAV9X8E8_9PEZI